MNRHRRMTWAHLALRQALAVLALAAPGAMVAGGAAREILPALPADHPPFASPGTAPAAQLPPGTVMARVDNAVITAGEVDSAVNAVPMPERLEYRTPAALRDLVDALVDRTLMARAARAAGLDQDAVLKEQLKATGQPQAPPPDQVLAEAWLARELDRIPAPTEAAINQYYRDHSAQFTAPARVRVTRVVTPKKEPAERLRGELARGITAEDLLSRHAGEIVSAENLWLQDAPKEPDLVTVALGLKQGQVSQPVAVSAGFAVLRADELAAARLRPLAEVRGGIAASLDASARQEATAQIRSRLRSGARIVVSEDALMSYLGLAPAPPRSSPP